MFNRWIEDGLTDVLEEEGIGCIPFSPLAQGLLTGRYLVGIPAGSRATQGKSMNDRMLSEETLGRIRALHGIAERRGQSLAQMAIRWVLRDPRVTSALIGASSVAQLEDSLKALDGPDLSADELAEIDRYAATSAGIDLWTDSSQR
jgi:L-glyceraldehyde 3-phosphate reductase